jgi:predicted metalloprotease with PDZ domain
MAIDGERCDMSNLAQLLNRKRAGECVEISFFHRDLLRHAQLVLQSDGENTCDLYWLDEATLSPEVLARKCAWLSSSQQDG